MAQLAGVSSHTPKGHGFDPQSGHVPVGSIPGWGVCTGGSQSMFFSHMAVSPCFSLSLPSSIPPFLSLLPLEGYLKKRKIESKWRKLYLKDLNMKQHRKILKTRRKKLEVEINKVEKINKKTKVTIWNSSKIEMIQASLVERKKEDANKHVMHNKKGNNYRYKYFKIIK